jgi:hypothetical protein
MIVNEITRYKKEGVKINDTLQILKKYAKEDRYFVQFSEIKKLGIHIRSKYETPLGVYSYFLNDQFVQDFEEDEIPFASERKYMVIFETKDDAKVWEIKEEDMPEENFYVWIEEIIDLVIAGAIRQNKIKMYGMAGTHNFIEDGEHYNILRTFKTDYQDFYDKYGHHPSGKEFFVWSEMFQELVDGSYKEERTGVLWNILRVIAGNPRQWRKLFVLLGVDGVVDYDTGTIHENEPEQAVFFALGSLRLVDIIDNKEPRKKKQNLKNTNAYSIIKNNPESLDPSNFEATPYTGNEYYTTAMHSSEFGGDIWVRFEYKIKIINEQFPKGQEVSIDYKINFSEESVKIFGQGGNKAIGTSDFKSFPLKKEMYEIAEKDKESNGLSLYMVHRQELMELSASKEVVDRVRQDLLNQEKLRSRILYMALTK